eukprot:TRINITY_DN2538_c0_g1_i2.p1 TRINITY_DN2538_c0_g1~~TRINITY_DN2538_c0_g1_i2.p1  ORF type:complete len:221 (-),score=29.04 TRINITY_DN2538_c0_g1_i2:217-879(-)
MTPASALVNKTAAQVILLLVILAGVFLPLAIFKRFLLPRAVPGHQVRWGSDVPKLNTFPGEGYDGNQLAWFIQVSDIHLSVYHPERAERFEQFVSSDVLKIIKPSMVFASGDLTDGKLLPSSVYIAVRRCSFRIHLHPSYSLVLSLTHTISLSLSLSLSPSPAVPAKDAIGLTSEQREEEWKTYHRILHSHGLLDHKPGAPVWIDIRGNREYTSCHLFFV